MNLAEIIGPLHWREPWWLLLALQPLALWWLGQWRRRARLDRYAERALQPWVVYRRPRTASAMLFSRASAYGLAWLCLAIGAAGPRVALEVPGQARAAGDTILAVIDLSASMAATDVAPSRLRRARLELLELLGRARGARVGLIVYAGRPHLYVPPTDDLAAVRFYLGALDRIRLPTRGSDAAGAMHFTRNALDGARQVFWLTDGDLGAADPARRTGLLEAARELRAAGATLSVLGMGTVEGAAIRAGDGNWLSAGGQVVVSRMDEAVLRAVADAGGGRYVAARPDDSDWAALYDSGPRVALRDESLVVWRELYPWLLLPGLVLLFLALLPCRWPRGATALLACLALAPGLFPGAARAADAGAAWNAQARADYATAAALYAGVGGYAGRLGEGVSRYRLGAYEDAVRQFSEAILAADSDEQRAVALHNLGNAVFQLGDYAAAVEAFGDALRYRPGHSPTEHNLEFSALLQARVERRLRADEAAARAGSGPRTGRAAEGTAVGDRTGLTLDQAANGRPRVPELAPDAEQARIEQLVRAGIARLRVAASGQSTGGGSAWRQDLQGARQRLLQIEDDRARLWNRVFEIEEGFDASPPDPLPLPGIAPW